MTKHLPQLRDCQQDKFVIRHFPDFLPENPEIMIGCKFVNNFYTKCNDVRKNITELIDKNIFVGKDFFQVLGLF